MPHFAPFATAFSSVRPVIDLDDLLQLAEHVALEASEILLTGLTDARRVVATKSSDTDLVTEVDQRSEAAIVSALGASRPDDGILGEEGANHPGSTGVRWVVDPLDGTTNYLYGLPPFSVSVAAEVDGVLAVGVVADPLAGELFSARTGGGATCNGVPITCTAKSHLGTALVATGFSYAADRRRGQAEVLRTVLPEIRDIRRAGAASIDLCRVAAGMVDGYWEVGMQPWDFAAGTVIAREAGALVGALDGDEPSTAFVLAAGPALYADLRELLVRAGA
jgi:myo-inositol-1(or 4)-monophosphatase